MKRIGIVTRGEDPYRQSESIRMALGMTLCDDAVEVFVLDAELKRSDAVNKNLETLTEMVGGKIYSNNRKNGFEYLSTEEIAKKLAECDVIIPY